MKFMPVHVRKDVLTYTMVDDEDYEALKHWHWRITGDVPAKRKTGYVTRRGRKDEGRQGQAVLLSRAWRKQHMPYSEEV